MASYCVCHNVIARISYCVCHNVIARISYCVCYNVIARARRTRGNLLMYNAYVPTNLR